MKPASAHPAQAVQGVAERSRLRQFQLPEHNYATMDVDNAPRTGARKTGHLSAEERRALRRQINEAGSDLYAQGQ